MGSEVRLPEFKILALSKLGHLRQVTSVCVGVLFYRMKTVIVLTS